MAIDTPARPRVSTSSTSKLDREQRHGLPSRALVVSLVLACLTLMVIDKAGGEDSPVAAARRTAGEVFGPAEAAVSTFVGPLAALPDALRTNDGLREDVADLEAENARLRRELRTAGYDENRIAEMQGLCAIAGDLGYALAPARVIGFGSAQSFSDTVTVDAGTDAGLHPDMTVLNNDGLVGRITAVTSHTATVLLASDTASTVGGRVGDSMELGFVHGRGNSGDDGSLELKLVDRSVMPRAGDGVFTYGSEGGAPYVAGVPIGEITRVYESVRETTYRAVLTPYVDFTALDAVGVVVPSGSQHAVIEADGSCGGRR